MTRIRRLGAMVLAVCVFTVSIAPAAFADAGGDPGSNAGCPGHQPPPRQAEAATTNGSFIAGEPRALRTRGSQPLSQHRRECDERSSA
jgi:hypothetical protein